MVGRSERLAADGRGPPGRCGFATVLRVVDALRRRGPASRADIARHRGALAGDRVVARRRAPRERPARRAQGGRRRRARRPPALLLALDPAAGGALGVDFGHAHLRVALADLNADVLAERHLGLDVDHDAARGARRGRRPRRRGPGRGRHPPRRAARRRARPARPDRRRTGTVGSTVILPGWRGAHAGDELASRLGMQVTVDNDANLGALAETTYGAARGARDLVYVKARLGRRRRDRPRRPAAPRCARHGRRARPRPRRGRRPRLPLRQPRLPGDRGRRARAARRSCASRTART